MDKGRRAVMRLTPQRMVITLNGVAVRVLGHREPQMQGKMAVPHCKEQAAEPLAEPLTVIRQVALAGRGPAIRRRP